MAKVGAQRAAELTGKSKSTIQRAMKSGKISFELDDNGRRVVDVSELERAFGLKKEEAPKESAQTSAERELEKASAMLEMERMKMRIKMLEGELEAAETRIEDLSEQRDKWQQQASQVLITSQHSQKEAERLREEMRQREERARQQRQKRLEERMKRMEAQNENASQSTGGQKPLTGNDSGSAADEKFSFTTLWQRVKQAV